jgi:hypothetical protein
MGFYPMAVVLRHNTQKYAYHTTQHTALKQNTPHTVTQTVKNTLHNVSEELVAFICMVANFCIKHVKSVGPEIHTAMVATNTVFWALLFTCVLPSFFLGVLDPEDGGDIFFRNVG